MARTATSEQRKHALEEAVPRKSPKKANSGTGNTNTKDNKVVSKLTPSNVTKTPSLLKPSVLKLSTEMDSKPSKVATSVLQTSDRKTPPILTLEDFGLSAARNNGDTLQCCVIFADGNVSQICFRCVPKTGKATSWYEKLFAVSVANGSVWTDNIKIFSTLPWYEKGLPQENSRGHVIRLFVINTDPVVFDKDQITLLGKHICAHLNVLNGNKKPKIHVADNFFWLPADGSVCMSDITLVK